MNTSSAAKQTNTTSLYIGAYCTHAMQGSQLTAPPDGVGARALGGRGGRNADTIGNITVAVAAIPLVTRYGIFII
jgi:hypothetical protein